MSNENSNEQTVFMMIPDKYVRCDVGTKYGLSRKFYITYLLISMDFIYSSFYSIFSVNDVIKFYRYTSSTLKKKCIAEIKEVLEYMSKKNMITFLGNLSKINCDTNDLISIHGESNFYDNPDEMIKITLNELCKIGSVNNPEINLEMLLVIYLYVKSYIYERSDDIKSDEYYKYPEAFLLSTEKIANDLNISQKIITKYLDFLTMMHEPLLVRKTLRTITFDNGQKIISPTIYALNKPGYENELEWASDLIYSKLNHKKRRGRPPIKTEQTRLININVPVSMYDQIQTAKLCYDNSITQYINTLIKHDLENHMDKYKQTVQLLKEFR